MTNRAATAREAGYVVREAQADDSEALGRVHVQAWRETYPGMIDQSVIDRLDPVSRGARWRQWLEQPVSPLRVLVGVDPAGEIAGMIVVGPNRDGDSPADTEVWAINLLADAKGTGLADALLQEAIADRSASLWVLADNDRAHGFYARHGFAPDGGHLYDEDLRAKQVRLVRTRR